VARILYHETNASVACKVDCLQSTGIRVSNESASKKSCTLGFTYQLDMGHSGSVDDVYGVAALGARIIAPVEQRGWLAKSEG
jgi:hypothetical protein